MDTSFEGFLIKSYYDELNAWHQKRFGHIPSYKIYNASNGKYRCEIQFNIPENDKGVQTSRLLSVEGETRSQAREAAANQGSSDAQYQLGYMYSEGLGVTRDYTESIRWYRKAADNGDADAIFCLANKYYNGQGVTQDYDKALELYHKAADKGVYQAMYVISECYTYGRGVKKDLNQANYWKQKAKELENKNK